MFSPSLKSIATFFAEFALVPSLLVLGLLDIVFQVFSATVIPEIHTCFKLRGANFTLEWTSYLNLFIFNFQSIPFLFVFESHVFVQILLFAVLFIAMVALAYLIQSDALVELYSFVLFLSLSWLGLRMLTWTLHDLILFRWRRWHVCPHFCRNWLGATDTFVRVLVHVNQSAISRSSRIAWSRGSHVSIELATESTIVPGAGCGWCIGKSGLSRMRYSIYRWYV